MFITHYLCITFVHLEYMKYRNNLVNNVQTYYNKKKMLDIIKDLTITCNNCGCSY